MGYHLLDMTAYARLDEYNYFRSLAYPYVGVTVNADITPLHARVRAEGLPFFLSLLYVTSRAANSIAAFRQRLRADGGAAANDFLLSFQSDLSALPVIRPKCIETTALGAALLAGLGAGLFRDVAETQQSIAPDRIFEPTLAESERQALLDGWKTAVSRVTRGTLS